MTDETNDKPAGDEAERPQGKEVGKDEERTPPPKTSGSEHERPSESLPVEPVPSEPDSKAQPAVASSEKPTPPKAAPTAGSKPMAGEKPVAAKKGPVITSDISGDSLIDQPRSASRSSE